MFQQLANQAIFQRLEMVNFGDHLDAVLALWTLVKLLFYVIPTLELNRAHDKEQLQHHGVGTSRAWRWLRDWSVLLILVPVVDGFIFFHVVINVIGRSLSSHNLTLIKCQVYGITAGILYLIILSNLQTLFMFSSGFMLAGQNLSFILFSAAAIIAWVILSTHHLYYIYRLNREIYQKIQ